MPYNGMISKQKRIVERDVETLFSPRALLTKVTIEDFKRFWLFHPSITVNNRTIFLSEKGRAALRRLRDLISDLPVLTGSVSKQDIYTQVLGGYNNWVERELQPTGQEFIEEAVDSLLAIVKEYEFLIKIEGIDIEDLYVLELGSVRIQQSDRALLQDVKFKGNLDIDWIYEQFKDSLWLIGSETGSADAASEKFEHRAVLAVGVLAVCGTILYKGAIWKSRVRAVISPVENRSAVKSLRWEIGGNNPSVSRKLGADQDLTFDYNSINYLNKECFLKQLSSLPDLNDRTELQDAIVRSLYWFADAHRDRIEIMQFLKLWSCAESFFSIKGDGITEINAKGIAAVLTFAGCNIVADHDYVSFKKRIKHLYGLRSKALHRAKFDHIKTKDLNDLSYWIAWLIISMVALTEQGYKTLNQIYEKISHIDRLYGDVDG